MLLTVNQLLDQLHSGRDTSNELQSQISMHLNTLGREIQALSDMLHSVGASERPLWRRRIQQLEEESQSQRRELGKFTSQAAAKQRHEEERQELLHRRTHGGDLSINIDAIARESRQLNESHSQIDDLLANAGAVRQALGQQGAAIKGIQKKMLSMLSTLGLSNNTLRMIERRLLGDQVILYGGMLATLGLLWFVFVHLRREEAVPEA